MNKKERNLIASDLEFAWYYKPKDERDRRRIQKMFEGLIEWLRK